MKISVIRDESKGFMTIAACDLAPGSEVFHENAPLLQYDESILSNYNENEAVSAALAGFHVFKTRLSPDQQDRILKLHGPVHGVRADLFREAASATTLPGVNSEKEVDLFVRVSCIGAINIFQRSPKYFVFEKASRLNHSCQPNCNMDINIENNTLTCRAIAHISQNEELTIEYNSNHRWKATHERRYAYLLSKEFTCHCPRCESIGDDTRQFDCVDPACKGVMMVCQPLNRMPIPGDVCAYTGVEYVEPHFLPCTMCHRAAPADYQTEMFALEATLPSQLNTLEAQDAALAKTEQFEKAHELLEELRLLTARCPRWHLLALQVKRLTGFLYTKMCLHEGKVHYTALARAMQENIDMYEHLTTFPNKAAYQFYIGIAEASQLNPAYSVLSTLNYYRMGLRMQLLLHGRENRNLEYDRGLQDILVPLMPEAPSLLHCAFCEESPLSVAFTLRRCGKCMKLAYCSVGCQKAHWKLHKKICIDKQKKNGDSNGSSL